MDRFENYSRITRLAPKIYFRERQRTDLCPVVRHAYHSNTYPYSVTVQEDIPWPKDLNPSYGFWPVNTVSEFPPEPHPLFGYAGNRWSFMQDIVGSRAKGIWYKPCHHEAYVALELRSGQLPLITKPHSMYAPNDLALSINPSDKLCCAAYINDILPQPPNDLVDDLSALAEKRFIDYIDPQTSLLNFIIELIELCEGNLSVLKRMKESLGKCAKRFASSMKRSLARGLSHPESVFLAWKFAVKPTLGDLDAMIHLYRTTCKKIAWLKRVNHSAVKVKFRRNSVFQPSSWTTSVPVDVRMLNYYVNVNYDEDPDLIPSRPYPINTPTDWWAGDSLVQSPECYLDFKLDPESWVCNFNAAGYVMIDIPDEYLSGIEGMGTLATALLGLHRPGEIVWEAIPFSWAIDYFLSERSKLERFKQLYSIVPTYTRDENGQIVFDESGINPYPLAKIIDSGHSWKFQGRWTVTFRNESSGTSHELGDFAYRLYKRIKGLPQVDSSAFRVPFTNVTRSALLGSVLIQKFRR